MYRILLLIKTWLQLDYEDLDDHVLGNIKSFVQSVEGSMTTLVLAREIISIAEQKVCLRHGSYTIF
jgi:hypothetical protein